ncbi:MAG: HAD-IA family hydrolase [Candidatus Woesearchaeota archaeon]|jgi:phosphoglycolate phosphatase|nr:HAD-IA family hydrolase [Candidatus Woesearchaeota archaeon]
MSKTLIFDVDGTILNSLDLLIDCLYLNANKSGIEVSKKGLYNLIENKSLHDIIKEFKLNKLQILYIVWKIKRDFNKRDSEVKPFERIKTLFEHLKSKNHKLYILTSNNKEFVEKIFKKEKLDFFDKQYYKSSLFGKAKHIQKIIDENNLNKEEVYYVGDEIRDIEASKAAGVKCISVSWGYNSKKLLEKFNPDYLVENIQEFKELL